MADFSRFRPTRQNDARWESLLYNPRPLLDAFLRESAAETSELLDFRRL